MRPLVARKSPSPSALSSYPARLWTWDVPDLPVAAEAATIALRLPLLVVAVVPGVAGVIGAGARTDAPTRRLAGVGKCGGGGVGRSGRGDDEQCGSGDGKCGSGDGGVGRSGRGHNDDGKCGSGDGGVGRSGRGDDAKCGSGDGGVGRSGRGNGGGCGNNMTWLSVVIVSLLVVARDRRALDCSNW